MSAFRVAFSGDFRNSDGSPSFPEFDLGPLERQPDLELDFLEPCEEIAAEQLRGYDALILLRPSVTPASFPGDGRLALVARFGVGYDNVDVAACTANDTALVITPDGVRRPVAQAIMTLMLALAGRLMIKDAITREGPAGWAKKTRYNGMGVAGRTLGSLGIGNIGAEMFRLARTFDMAFIAHDPYADPGLAAELGVALVGLEEVFRQSDFLAVNCPLNERTRHLVNAERLALMKPTAYLINTARGPIVDQVALTETLQARRIAGAGLDVFDKEPPDAGDPLLTLDNVILGPHGLCWTDQIFAGNGAADVAATLEVMAGRVPRGVVNREVLEKPGWQTRLKGFAERFGG